MKELLECGRRGMESERHHAKLHELLPGDGDAADVSGQRYFPVTALKVKDREVTRLPRLSIMICNSG